MKFIKDEVLQHLDNETLTLCRCVLLVTDKGVFHGATTLDRDVFYKGVLYKAADGIEPAMLVSDNDQAVDHSEALMLAALEKTGLTAEKIKGGYLNRARWELHEVDYMQPSIGYLVDGGIIGTATVGNNNSVKIQLLSVAEKLSQKIGCVDSLRCRAVFGTPANSIYGCGVDTTGFWKTGTVSAVDSEEPTILFQTADDTLAKNTNYARVQFTSGKNSESDRLFQVEQFTLATKTIMLVEETPFKIEIGDEFKIRLDCGKTFEHCQGWGNHLNYKGEPHIPVADGKEAEWALV